MKRNNVTTLTALAMFLALATLLNYIENFIPVFAPGIKLGLANTINIIVLYFFGRRNYFLIGLFRVILVSVMFTGLFSSNFIFSFLGFIFSSLIVIILSFSSRVSIYSLSISSAIFHSLGQIVAGILLVDKAIIMYLPILIMSSIISSVFIAYISSLTIKKLEKFI